MNSCVFIFFILHIYSPHKVLLPSRHRLSSEHEKVIRQMTPSYAVSQFLSHVIQCLRMWKCLSNRVLLWRSFLFWYHMVQNVLWYLSAPEAYLSFELQSIFCFLTTPLSTASVGVLLSPAGISRRRSTVVSVGVLLVVKHPAHHPDSTS